jgi:flavin reductase (DIM6/NTAB) family NADH-FMN oxidoreductase RutF
MIMFSAANRHPLKDTLRNVLAMREFVVNIVSEEIAEAMNLTCRRLRSRHQRIRGSGFTPSPATLSGPARA